MDQAANAIDSDLPDLSALTLTDMRTVDSSSLAGPISRLLDHTDRLGAAEIGGYNPRRLD